MSSLYRLVSIASVLPASGLCLLKKDLGGDVFRRFWPVSVKPKQNGGFRVWMQAASAGEVSLASQFAKKAKEAGEFEILVTTNTDSGFRQAQKCGFEHVRRFPFDSAQGLKRLFDSFKPQALVLMEMELWPGLLDMADSLNIPVIVINARMGESSVSRYRKLNNHLGNFLSKPFFLGRTDSDVVRLEQAGVPLGRMLITGEMKIDAAFLGIAKLKERSNNEKLFFGGKHSSRGKMK